MDPLKAEYMLLEEIESQRGEYETDSKWESRSQFMKTHLNNITKKRLITLSNCYVNVKHDGCKYPPDLMKELDGLIAAIPLYLENEEKGGTKRFLEDASAAASKRFHGMQAMRKKQGNQPNDGPK